MSEKQSTSASLYIVGVHNPNEGWAARFALALGAFQELVPTCQKVIEEHHEGCILDFAYGLDMYARYYPTGDMPALVYTVKED